MIMSLDWDVSECTFDRDSDLQVANADRLIWQTLAVDLGSITEKNLSEWVFRCAVIKILNNRINDSFGPVTEDFLRPYIGLHTNVSTTSHAKFMNKCKDMLQRDAMDAIRRQKQKDDKTLCP
jgi:hypothetical protein